MKNIVVENFQFAIQPSTFTVTGVVKTESSTIMKIDGKGVYTSSITLDVTITNGILTAANVEFVINASSEKIKLDSSSLVLEGDSSDSKNVIFNEGLPTEQTIACSLYVSNANQTNVKGN